MAMMNFDISMYGHRHADCYGNGFCKDVVLSEILNRRNFQTLEEQGKLERYKTRLQRIIRKAKQEYFNMTEVNTPTHAICEYSASNKFVALYLRLVGNKIMSQECKSNNSINVDGFVFSYVLEATLSTLTPQGKLCFLTRLQRLDFNPKVRINVGASSPSTKKKGAITTSLVKEGSSSTCLPKKKGSSTSLIKEGSSTSLIKEGSSSTCLTKKKGATTPVSEWYHKDKAQGCDDCTKASSHAPSTNKKFKFSFQGVCNDFHPRSKLPEGLLLAQSIYCANSALAFYNDKHGTEYKLVEPLSSARIYDYGVRFHCNFTAVKLKKDAAQPKLFFANFIYLKYGLRDMYCSIIDPAKAIFWCCEACPPDLAHCHLRAGMYNVLRGSPIEYFEDVRKEVYAEIALDVYNKKHGTEYELVESLETNVVPVSFGTYRFHCNFKAELMTPDNSDGSIKLFFGDVVKSFSFSDGEFCILESTEGLDDHCSICRKGAVFHPGHHETPYITCASM